MPRVKRSAPTRSRRERSEATRARITAAAHDLFCTRGYTGTRMTDVADAAGVAVQTVYFVFHTKAELLRACYDRGVLGEENLTPPEQPWWAALFAAPTAEEAVGHFVAGNLAILARVAILDDVVRSALHEPDAVEVRERSEGLRRDGYAEVVTQLQRSFGLRDGLTPAAATDLLLTLAGPSVYRSLVVDYDWSHDSYAQWATSMISEALLAPPR